MMPTFNHHQSRRVRGADLNPGDVVLSSLGDGKKRPWLILWIEDGETPEEQKNALFVATTAQRHFPGVIATEWSKHPYAASWARLVPIRASWPVDRLFHEPMPPMLRRRLTRMLRASLALDI